MTLTTRIVTEVAYHEGIVREAYKDSVGVLTWSAGITSASGHSVERYVGNPQPLARCLDVYVWLLREKYLPSVLRAFKGHDLTESQLAAALSFHWNTGAISRASWVQHFKAGDNAKARKAFMNWVKPVEITDRRKAERDLFFDGKWSGDGTIMEWTVVRPNKSVDWSKGRRVNVSGEIAALLGGVAKPATTRNAITAPRDEPSLWANIIAAIARIFGGKK